MPSKIDHFGGVHRWTLRFDANKASISNRKIYLAAVSCDGICEYAIKHLTAPAIRVATSARLLKIAHPALRGPLCHDNRELQVFTINVAMQF